MSGENAPVKSQATAEGGRYLIIVARDQADLWHYLRQNLELENGMEVIHDRRQGGRWQWTQTRELQARGIDRRRNSDEGSEPRYRPFVIVPR